MNCPGCGEPVEVTLGTSPIFLRAGCGASIELGEFRRRLASEGLGGGSLNDVREALNGSYDEPLPTLLRSLLPCARPRPYVPPRPTALGE